MIKSMLLSMIMIGAFIAGQIQASPSHNKNERALIAYMKVSPGTENQFLLLAKTVVEESRKETGNLQYQLHQSMINPQLFVFYELFKTDADMQFHRNSAHVQEFLSKTKEITLEFSLEEFTPLENL